MNQLVVFSQAAYIARKRIQMMNQIEIYQNHVELAKKLAIEAQQRMKLVSVFVTFYFKATTSQQRNRASATIFSLPARRSMQHLGTSF